MRCFPGLPACRVAEAAATRASPRPTCAPTHPMRTRMSADGGQPARRRGRGGGGAAGAEARDPAGGGGGPGGGGLVGARGNAGAWELGTWGPRVCCLLELGLGAEPCIARVCAPHLPPPEVTRPHSHSCLLWSGATPAAAAAAGPPGSRCRPAARAGAGAGQQWGRPAGGARPCAQAACGGGRRVQVGSRRLCSCVCLVARMCQGHGPAPTPVRQCSSMPPFASTRSG